METIAPGPHLHITAECKARSPLNNLSLAGADGQQALIGRKPGAPLFGIFERYLR